MHPPFLKRFNRRQFLAAGAAGLVLGRPSAAAVARATKTLDGTETTGPSIVIVT